MVVITLTPRSFVTESFDTLYIPFTQYVYDTLLKSVINSKEDWWRKYFRKTIEVLKDRKDRKGYPIGLSQTGSLDEIREKYDEKAIFWLIAYNNDWKLAFLKEPIIITLSKKLHKIRNDWAHRDWDFDYKWADGAIDLMIQLASEIESPETVNKIKDLRKKMHINESSRNREIVCTADDLISLLEVEIFSPNEKALLENTIDICEDERKELLRKINHSREMLADEDSVEGVVTFFWNAIISRSDSYIDTRKIGKTFEDIRNRFEQKCYEIN